MSLENRISVSRRSCTILGKLGEGSFATVFKAKELDGRIVALKCTLISKLAGRQEQDNLLREISILKNLSHRHVVRLLNCGYDDEYIFLMMEYCELGDLRKYIVKDKGLPRSLIHRFLQQLACGLKYLRSHSVSHFDLKPENLLVTKCPLLCLKIADFGFAQFMSDEDYSNHIMGSPAYMAPEMFKSKEYTPKADLWSVGVILYVCLFGRFPISNRCCEIIAAAKNDYVVKLPESPISPTCRNLLTRLLKSDPDERMDFDQFFAHTYIDLEHYPSEDSYESGLVNFYAASGFDSIQNYHKAFDCYCDALRYFIPHFDEMTDTVKKRQLQQKIIECINRAEELRSIFFILNRKALTEPQTSYLSIFADKAQAVLSLYEPNSRPYLAIECGFAGQMHLVDGYYQLAVKKLQRSLNTILHYSLSETVEERANLLGSQVKIWSQLVKDAQILHLAVLSMVGSIKSEGIASARDSKRRSSNLNEWTQRHHSGRKKTDLQRRMAIINSFEMRMKMTAFLPVEIQESLARTEEERVWKKETENMTSETENMTSETESVISETEM